uniref:Uncharacterized protein n=1 Tax=Lactuca sativa TaxID=4236 RepID=A0A9R1XP84_LACSA|nr:hypothetical protein LSAT_V11C400183230 [Lactuca sativa]
MSGLEQLEQIKSDISTQRHFLCNREGKPKVDKVDTLDPQHNKMQRRKDSFRSECKAKIKYIVDDFVEQHTHDLFGKGIMYLSSTKRKLDYS